MHTRLLATILLASLLPSVSRAAWPVEYEASLTAGIGGNGFAPYYIMSNRNGTLTNARTALLGLRAEHSLDSTRRFSYAAGIEAYGGPASSVAYSRYGSDGWTNHDERPQGIWLQQLYGQVKYRQVTLVAGLRRTQSRLLDNALSSGDMVRGCNTRPIPGVSAGFIDFVDIPLTDGWVQIDGEVMYGKFTDNGWMESHYNYYNNHITTGSYYTYKRCYFRTRPDAPLSVTVGMQAAGVFGGVTRHYRDGQLRNEVHNKSGLEAFARMFLPLESSDEGYYLGNSLGSWDIFVRYRLPWGDSVRACLQHPFETGSGIGFLNGFDGLWGLEYRTSTPGYLNGIVVEYIDTTNQSGPNHWDPDDNPGTTLGTHTSGGDEYYNNDFYNSYINYGMSIGTPMLPAPIYNTDGYPAYVINRIRGCHVAVTGDISSTLSYRIMGGYRKGYGTIRQPLSHTVHDTSAMAEVSYRCPGVDGLSVKGQVAFDSGDMLGNRFGASVTVSYGGLLDIGR